MNLLDSDPILKQVLTAAYEYWLTIARPPEERQVCFSWIEPVYRRMFGGTFHPSKLQRLADVGLLTLGETSRGGTRRYYRIADAHLVRELIQDVLVSSG